MVPRPFAPTDLWSVCNICHPDICREIWTLVYALLRIKLRLCMLLLLLLFPYPFAFLPREHAIGELPSALPSEETSLKTIYFDQILKDFFSGIISYFQIIKNTVVPLIHGGCVPRPPVYAWSHGWHRNHIYGFSLYTHNYDKASFIN